MTSPARYRAGLEVARDRGETADAAEGQERASACAEDDGCALRAGKAGKEAARGEVTNQSTWPVLKR